MDFSTIEAQADYIARLCGAWDFGIIPTRETFALLSSWRDAFDTFPVPASPAYAAFRSWFGWPPIPQWPPLQADYEPIDARDGRGEDQCRDLI
jgi:hypothetical protein